MNEDKQGDDMKQIVVTAAVIEKEGRLFMAQRRPQDSEGGKWEFPGGKIEWGEEPRQSLCRELQEELGIRAEVGPLLDVISEVKGNMHLILLYFACRIIEGEPKPIECQAVSWWAPDDIDGLAKPPLPISDFGMIIVPGDLSTESLVLSIEKI